MRTTLALSVLCVILVMVSTYVPIPLKPTKPEEFCMCVPFWQCDEDYKQLITDDISLMQARQLDKLDGDNINSINSICSEDFDLCCKIQCGKRRNSLRKLPFGLRILGENNQAGVGEFPWMLGILFKDVYKCGASLIHPRVALTAAHCVEARGTYMVRAGEWDWNSTDETMGHQDRTVIKIITHPMYHAPSLRNDISLLLLDEPFHLTDNVGIVCLPPPGTKFNQTNCIATGWGKNSFKSGTYQSILKMVELPMVHRNRCLKVLQEVRLGSSFKLHESFVCAGGEHNKDTCKGDGGSPLVCPISDTEEKYVQAGIVSWGLTCGLRNTPGVYVNVALFRNWIDKQMKFFNLENYIYEY